MLLPPMAATTWRAQGADARDSHWPISLAMLIGHRQGVSRCRCRRWRPRRRHGLGDLRLRNALGAMPRRVTVTISAPRLSSPTSRHYGAGGVGGGDCDFLGGEGLQVYARKRTGTRVMEVYGLARAESCRCVAGKGERSRRGRIYAAPAVKFPRRISERSRCPQLPCAHRSTLEAGGEILS